MYPMNTVHSTTTHSTTTQRPSSARPFATSIYYDHCTIAFNSHDYPQRTSTRTISRAIYMIVRGDEPLWKYKQSRVYDFKCFYFDEMGFGTKRGVLWTVFSETSFLNGTCVCLVFRIAWQCQWFILKPTGSLLVAKVRLFFIVVRINLIFYQTIFFPKSF